MSRGLCSLADFGITAYNKIVLAEDECFTKKNRPAVFENSQKNLYREGKRQMAAEKVKTSFYDIVYLSGCAVNGNCPDLQRVRDMDLNSLYDAACSLSLSALTYKALESAYEGELPDDPVLKKWKEKSDFALYKNLRFDIETKKLTDFLEKNKIWYLLMKGMVLKDLYPAPSMREMADVDILFDAGFQKTIRDWFLDQGYEVKAYQELKDDDFLKKPFYNFELHHDLFVYPADPCWVSYYENVKGKLIPDQDCPYRCHFKDEDFYIYMLMHMYKHQQGPGTGLRSLLDCYVFLKAKGQSLDWAYVRQEFSKLEAESFEEEVRTLAGKVFGTPEEFSINLLSEKERSLLDSFLFFGTFGTTENEVSHRLTKMKEQNETSPARLKLRYIRERLFPDPEIFKTYHPFFDRHRWLLPVGYLYRLIDRGFGNYKKRKSELEALIKS